MLEVVRRRKPVLWMRLEVGVWKTEALWLKVFASCLP